jgi:Protein of unknown function, DUF488.
MTSYYAKSGSDKDAVAISQGVPKWFKGRVYKKVAPSWRMIKLPEPQYRIEYANLLSKLDAEEVYNELGKNAIILCYEKPNEFCHRRLVADWIKNKLGIYVPEVADMEMSSRQMALL